MKKKRDRDKEEDDEECNMEHDGSSPDNEEIPDDHQTERETFLSKNKLTWPSSLYDNEGWMAAHNMRTLSQPATFSLHQPPIKSS